MNLQKYDKYIVAFSGGKDSIACFLHLLELGIPKHKIELWHHLVDGQGETFMDWNVTEDYCRKFAEHFGVQIFMSWKIGGFHREMHRNNQKTAPTMFETPDGLKQAGGIRGKEGTRRMFPQVSADLSTRWCSAYLKIDVCSLAISNQDRFRGIRTCLISGERGEESAARAKYNMLEPDRSDLRNGKRFQRYVDRARPVRDWTEQEVWDIIERHGVVVHPCYYMGWSRCSCQFCIFGNADQFASAYKVSPEKWMKVAECEEDFGHTMKRDVDLLDLTMSGTAYQSITDEMIELSNSYEYTGDIITNDWVLPSGAFGESCGPQ